MTIKIVDLLQAQTKRTNESSRQITSAIWTAAFTVAYERVLDHHPEARTEEDRFDLATRFAASSLREAARDMQQSPPAQISSYSLT
ncbi:MAG: hypothetical protein JWM46_560 [Candidatus Kaiserbacteria bacterium]|nr:hypothetical protein [Candidatus Kaiserbacteria bacterium]